MQTVNLGLRTPIVHAAWVYGIATTDAGNTAIATASGVFEAVSGGYEWQTRNTGLDAWTIDRIRVTPSTTYLALNMGAMRSSGASFEFITTGITHNSQVFDIVDAG